MKIVNELLDGGNFRVDRSDAKELWFGCDSSYFDR